MAIEKLKINYKTQK